MLEAAGSHADWHRRWQYYLVSQLYFLQQGKHGDSKKGRTNEFLRTPSHSYTSSDQSCRPSLSHTHKPLQRWAIQLAETTYPWYKNKPHIVTTIQQLT